MVFGSFWNSVEKNNNTECFGDLVVRTRGFEKSFGLDNKVFGNSGNLKVNYNIDNNKDTNIRNYYPICADGLTIYFNNKSLEITTQGFNFLFFDTHKHIHIHITIFWLELVRT